MLVPTIYAQVGGWEFYGRSNPSNEVGGDLLDLAGGDHNWDAALLMRDSRLRVGEALALEWSDVSLLAEPGFVRVREGKSNYARRAVPLTARSREMLQSRRKVAQSLNVFAEAAGRCG